MADAARPSRPGPAVDQSRRLGPFAALDHRFEVDVPTTSLADELARVLSDLESSAESDPTGCGRYVVHPGSKGLELTFDDEVIDSGPTEANVLAMLLWDVNRRAVEASVGRALVFHAGAVEVDGQALVLPAEMEAGKTTLVTGLVRAGCGYLSDELACIPDPGTHVRPYPKSLSLDPGSWHLFPELAPSASSLAASPNQWLVTADTIRPGASRCEPHPLGRVVLPIHRSGATTSIARLRPVDALRALASCAFRFHEEPARLLPRLARLAESIAVDALVVGDGVDRAVELVLDPSA